MFYITGDTHGNFLRVLDFCRKMKTTADDTMIILGDAGLNFYGGKIDAHAKRRLREVPITLFCIHGNHEMRPETISSYKEGTFCGGKILFEPEYPNILFAVDGEVYQFDDYSCLVVGGAYSVDKFYRLARGYGWWADEQPSASIKARVEKRIASLNGNVDIMLTHTCPLKYEPTEVFLSGIPQDTVDKTTEEWLDKIENMLTYRKWYCGHYHTTKKIDKIQFMFEDFDVLGV